MNILQEPSRQIKSGTAVAHALTEKALMKQIKGINSEADYAELLYCLYGYFAPVEKLLDKYGTSIISDYNERRKADSLWADLQQLRAAYPEKIAEDLPEIRDISQALGCLYVLEGSVLGGSIIKKRIQTLSPDIPIAAFTFLSGYHQHTPEMWQSFIAYLNQYFDTNQNIEAAITSANECFAKLENWIEQYFTLYPVAKPVKQ